MASQKLRIYQTLKTAVLHCSKQQGANSLCPVTLFDECCRLHSHNHNEHMVYNKLETSRQALNAHLLSSLLSGRELSWRNISWLLFSDRNTSVCTECFTISWTKRDSKDQCKSYENIPRKCTPYLRHVQRYQCVHACIKTLDRCLIETDRDLGRKKNSVSRHRPNGARRKKSHSGVSNIFKKCITK